MEQTLRRAFREQRKSPQPAPFRFGWRGRFAWAAAAAAVVVVAFWVSTNRVTPRPEPTPEIAAQPVRESAVELPVPDRLATLPATETPVAAVPEPDKRPKGVSRPAIALTPTEPVVEAVVVNDPQQLVASAATPPAREITTDFLPLVYGDDLSSYEGGQLVRVRLPSEALTYFGLPAHGFTGGRIPADVLLAEDGTARAVRFVRYARTGDTQAAKGPGF